MKGGMVKGLLTGAVLGGAAATIFGVMNWRTERRWCRQAHRTGRWMANKADELFNR